MTNIALHMRITGLTVSDGDVNTRTAAIAVLKSGWGKVTAPAAIVTKASEVAVALGGDGVPPSPLGDDVQGAMNKKGASAFIYSESPLDVGIISGVAAAEYLVANTPGPSGWYIADLWAATLWLSLSFQPTLADSRREALRQWVLTTARDRCLAGANAARQRTVVKKFSELKITAGEEDKFSDQFKTATTETIDTLVRNAALDREEIDFLWASLLERSSILNRPLKGLSETEQVIASAFDAVQNLRRLPSESHKHLALKPLNQNPAMTLAELLAGIETLTAAISPLYQTSLAAQLPTVFPLVFSIVSSPAVVPGSEAARLLEEWGARALLEGALLRMCANGPSSL